MKKLANASTNKIVFLSIAEVGISVVVVGGAFVVEGKKGNDLHTISA